jgi:hypothetical protein
MPAYQGGCRITWGGKDSDREVVGAGTPFCYGITNGQDAGAFAIQIQQLLCSDGVKVLTISITKQRKPTTMEFN